MKTIQENDFLLEMEDTISYSYREAFIDESIFPVIKINTEGKILYANSASFDYFREWLIGRNDFLPMQFLENYSGVLDLQADFSFAISTKTGILHFDVIGFREGGYIGMYGYKLTV